MNIASLLTAMLIAVGFVAWPVIGKYSGVSGAWVGTLVMSGTALVMILLSGRKMAYEIPTTKAFVILAVASIMNGVAVYIYSMKTVDPAIPTGIFIVIVSIFMAFSAPLMDWALNGAVPTARQASGLLCAVVAIYLLGR